MEMPKMLKIRWVDSWCSSGWTSRSECHGELMKCETVGFLVEEGQEHYCLALNRCIQDGFRPFGELVTIPKVSVISVGPVVEEGGEEA
jgi:hypothetical protein